MLDNDVVILMLLVAVAAFLLFRLRGVLGERSGFENPEQHASRPPNDVEESNVVAPFNRATGARDDSDIFAFAEPDTPLGGALKAIKDADPNFSVTEFMDGARSAYELLLTAFESGDKSALKPLLSDEVFAAFSEVIDDRAAQGLSIDMRFVGIRTAEPIEATLTEATRVAEISVRYSAEVVSATRDASGEVVDGDPASVQRISDVWTYSRRMDSEADPNWTLTATGG